MKLGSILRQALVIMLFSAGFAAAAPEDRPASLGPLEWKDPNAEKIDSVTSIYGNPRLGLVNSVGRRVQRVSNEDKWYLATYTHIQLMGINRRTAQMETEQVLETGRGWCVSPDGSRLFTPRHKPVKPGSFENADIWECFDLKDGRSLWTQPPVFTSCDACFTPDGKQLITVSTKGPKGGLVAAVTWYDAATGEKVREVSLPDVAGFSTGFSDNCLGVSSQGVVVVARGGDTDNKLFVIRDGAGGEAEIGEESVETTDTLDVRMGGVRNDLVAVYTDSVILLYRLEGGKLKKINETDTTPKNDNSYPNNVTFSPDGTVMLASTYGRTFIISTAESANPILKRLTLGGTLGEYNKDGRFFVFFDDGGGTIYNTTTWEEMDRAELEMHPAHCCPIVDAGFSMNGNLIISNDKQRLLLWSKDGRLLAELTSPRDTDGHCPSMQSPIIVDSVQKVYACDGWDFLEWDLNEIARLVKSKPVNTPSVAGKVVFQERKSRISEPEVMNISVDSSGKNLITATYNTVRYRPLDSPAKSTEVPVPKDDIMMKPRDFMKSEFYPGIVVKCGSDTFSLDPTGKEEPVKIAQQFMGIDIKNARFFNVRRARPAAYIGTTPFGSKEESEDKMTLPEGWSNGFGEALLVSPDGRWLVAHHALEETLSSIAVIDWETKKIVWDKPMPWRVTTMALSRDQTRLLVGSTNRSLYVFDFKRMCAGGQ